MSDSPFWIFLFGALSVYPFFPLRHVPVMKRLKIPFRRLFFYATIIMLVQGASYLWLSQTFSLGLAELAWHRKLFMLPYVLLTLHFSKDTPTKTLFMDFFMVGIVMATIDGSFILCKTLFAQSYITSPRMTDTLIRLCLIAVIYPPLYLFFTKVLKPIMEIKSGDVWRYITAIPVSFAVISIVTTMEAFAHEISTVFIFLRLFIIIGSVLVCSLMAQVVRRMEQAAIAEEQAKQAQRLLAMQGEQYARLDNSIKAARAARHDLRHHLSVIKELTAGSENAELDSYIDKYTESLPTDTELVVCKNYAVNSIAAHYITLAKSRGIGVEFRFQIERESKIPDTDFCIILGNLLENAIAGALTAPDDKRFFSVCAEPIGGKLSLVIDNSFDGVVQKDGDAFLSRKRDGKSEGIGLSSVFAVVEKLGGRMKVEYTEDTFMVSVLLAM